MKKIISIVLVMIMVISSYTCVMAENAVIDKNPVSDASVDVNGTFDTNGNSDLDGETYNVTVTWDAIAFNFAAESYDTASHAYTGEWTKTGDNTIKVQNDSSTQVKATCTVNNTGGYVAGVNFSVGTVAYDTAGLNPVKDETNTSNTVAVDILKASGTNKSCGGFSIYKAAGNPTGKFTNGKIGTATIIIE